MIDANACVMRLESTDNNFTVRFSTPEQRAAFRQALHNVACTLGVSYYKGDGIGSVLVSPGRRASALAAPPVDHSALTALQLEHLFDTEAEIPPSSSAVSEQHSESIRLERQSTPSTLAASVGLRALFRDRLLSVRNHAAAPISKHVLFLRCCLVTIGGTCVRFQALHWRCTMCAGHGCCHRSGCVLRCIHVRLEARRMQCSRSA